MITDLVLNNNKLRVFPYTETGLELWVHNSPEFPEILFRTDRVDNKGFSLISPDKFNQTIFVNADFKNRFAIAVKDMDGYIVKQFWNHEINPPVIIETIVNFNYLEYDKEKEILTAYFPLRYDGLETYFYVSLDKNIISEFSQNQSDNFYFINQLNDKFHCLSIQVLNEGKVQFYFPLYEKAIISIFCINQ